MRIQDSLDKQQVTFNLSGHATNQSTKHAMQNMYRQQLDSCMIQKSKQKSFERQRQMIEKQQFNQRANNNKQSQRIKQQAYKNYYNMLLSNQEQLQASYISPFTVRDNMKERLIKNSVEQAQNRNRGIQIEEKRRQMQKKNMYRSQLMMQIEQKRKADFNQKQEQQRNKEQYRKNGKLPEEINRYERQRHVQQMNRYKEDLDKGRMDKEVSRSRITTEYQYNNPPTHNSASNLNNQHNALINPVPYNIQNPYILREMNRQSYLASLGNQNMIN